MFWEHELPTMPCCCPRTQEISVTRAQIWAVFSESQSSTGFLEGVHPQLLFHTLVSPGHIQDVYHIHNSGEKMAQWDKDPPVLPRNNLIFLQHSWL